MKKSYKVFLLILFLLIGFAAVSTTLLINGTFDISENKEDFDVFFYSAMLDDLIVSNSVISEDKKIITYSTNKLTIPKTSSTLVFSVINNSRNYDANVSISCNIPSDPDFSVDVTPTEMFITAGKRMDGNIKATLLKPLTEDKNINISCNITATPVERTSIVDKVYDATKYDTVLIGDSIMQGYGNNLKSFGYYLSNDGLSINILNVSKNSSMLFNSPYVDETQLILDNQIMKQLFGSALNVKNDALIIMNGGSNDLVYNLQYASYSLGVVSEDDFSSPTFFNDVMASDNLVKRIYDSLSGLAMTFPNEKIVYIKPRLIPEGVTKEYYKDVSLINNDIDLFNKSVDLWYERIGSKKYSNLYIIDSNDYILESDLRYSIDASDGLHWIESAYLKIYEEIKKIKNDA